MDSLARGADPRNAALTDAGRRRGLALAVLCAATLMVILDGTIVTVALPSIQRGLGFPVTGLTWVMNAYLIAFAGLLLLAGRLGDLIGRKRVFLAGLALFAVASLACGLATNPAALVTARFIQGAGGALITAVGLGMITTLYPEPGERARAIAAYSFTGAGGASVGLVLGGILTQAIGWRWAFFVNLPIAVFAGAPAVRLLRAEPDLGLRAGADWLGAFLVTGGLMAGIAALVETGGHGWGTALPAGLAGLAGPVGLAGVAAGLLAGFFLRQARAAVPLLPPRVLRSPAVRGANLAQVLVIAAAFGFQVVITLFMQRSLGYGPGASGLGLAPTAVVIGAISLGLSARLGARFGNRAVLLTGLALITAALGGLAALAGEAGAPGAGGYLVWLLPALLIFGAGGGLTLPALAMLGMSDATPDDAGVVSGLFNTTQQVGAALGVALLTTLAVAGPAATGAARHAAGLAVVTSGYQLSFAVGAGLAAGSLVVVAVLLRPRTAAGASAVPADHPGDPAAGLAEPVRRLGGVSDNEPGRPGPDAVQGQRLH